MFFGVFRGLGVWGLGMEACIPTPVQHPQEWPVYPKPTTEQKWRILQSSTARPLQVWVGVELDEGTDQDSAVPFLNPTALRTPVFRPKGLITCKRLVLGAILSLRVYKV